MDICRYEEIKQLINQDYNNFISENSVLKFTFSGATSRLLNEFSYMIGTSEIEKIMIYTQLALWGIKYGELREEICEEVTNIILTNRLSNFEGKVEPSDFEDIKTDLEKIKFQLDVK